jgi:hypothetical protein
MGVRNKKREEFRLDSEALGARFLNEIQTGLNFLLA